MKLKLIDEEWLDKEIDYLTNKFKGENLLLVERQIEVLWIIKRMLVSPIEEIKKAFEAAREGTYHKSGERQPYFVEKYVSSEHYLKENYELETTQ